MATIDSSVISSSSSTLFDELPKEKWWVNRDVYQWEGFWYLLHHLEGVIAARSKFDARNDDILLASCPKTGSTWLKALIPCIMNFNGHEKAEEEEEEKEEEGDDDDSGDLDPLLKNHPNAFMPSLEIKIYRENPNPDLSGMVSPRLFRTHIPFTMLPESIQKSGCKIVYIAREPKDMFVSWWHFLKGNTPPELGVYPIADLFESFCKGVHPYGPYHDHVLGYWNASLKRPEKILFLKYEEMKRDTKGQLKRLATFLGKTYVKEEELDKVIWKCSLDRLKNLEVNKSGIDPWSRCAHKTYFRLGLVGDWKNSLSTDMKERLDEITRKKLQGSGLDL